LGFVGASCSIGGTTYNCYQASFNSGSYASFSTGTYAGKYIKSIKISAGTSKSSTTYIGFDNITWVNSLPAPASTDATLSSLAVGSAGGGTLAPSFTSATLLYNYTIGAGSTSISLAAGVTDPGAHLSIGSTAVTSAGSASVSIAVSPGLNTIPVTVTAEDGTTTKRYDVIVLRAVATASVGTAVLTNTTRTTGQSTTMSIGSASVSAGSLTFQWYVGATPISGATNATYATGSLTTGDTGSYSVNVTTTLASGSTTAMTTATAGTLTVSPVISFSVGSATESLITGAPYSASFSISGGSGSYTVDWVTTGGVLQRPTGLTLGSASGGTVLISGAFTGSAGTYSIRLIGTDSNGASTSTGSFSQVVSQGTANPIAPTGVSLNSTSLSDGQLRLSWTGLSGDASTGYSPISKYVISYQLVTGSASYGSLMTGSVSATTSTLVITGLLPGRSYQAYVHAVNEAGKTGAASTIYTAEAFGTVATPLAAPTSVSTNAIDGGLVVSFTPPAPAAGSNNAITGYYYSLSGGSASVWSTWSSGSSFTIGSLSNGSAYSIKIAATNGAGTGLTSLLSTGSSVPGKAPSVPQTLTLASGSAGTSLIGSFVSSADGGGYLVTYKYQYAIMTGSTIGTYEAWSNVSSGSSFTISGLTNGTSYSVQLKATNALGDSEAVTQNKNIATAGRAVITSAPTRAISLTVGQSNYSLTFAAVGSTGETLSPKWYKIGSPDVLKVSAWTYTITTVGSADAGSYYYTVDTTEPINNTQSTYSSIATPIVISVKARAVVVNTALPTAAVGGSISSTLSIGSTGYGTISWSVGSGTSLPSGLSLTSGVISGSPTVSTASTSFTVIATDQNGVASEAKTISAVVNSQLALITLSLPSATFGVAYSQQLVATGGVTTYVWSVTGGSASMPLGLSMSSSGLISGTPSESAVTKKFTAVVTDALGSATSRELTISLFTSVPDAPVLTVGSISSSTINLSWTAPSSGATPLTYYYISYTAPHGESEDDDEENSSNGVIPISVGSLSYRLAGLTNGRTYTISISAKNSGGGVSPSSNSITGAPGSLPGTPRSVSTVLAHGGMDIGWTKPSANGGFNISSYVVQCKPLGGSYTTVSGTVHSNEGSLYLTATGLTPATSYICHVLATTTFGSSEYSSETTALVYASTPSALTAGSADASVKGQITVTIYRNQAPGANGGNTIQSYIATLKTHGEASDDHEHDSEHKSCSITRTGGSWDSEESYVCVIKDTKTKGDFDLSLVAVSSFGTSSELVLHVPVTGTPQTLTIPTFTNAQTNVINGTPSSVTSGSAQKKVGDSDFSIGASLSSGLRPKYAISSGSGVCSIKESKYVHITGSGTCVVSIVQDGKTDDDEEEADYALLTGTNTVSFVIAPVAPGSPSFSTITPGAAQIIATWSAPTSGGAPTVYRIEHSLNAGSTWVSAGSTSATTFTITGLSNGVAYKLRLNAGNSSGSSAWVVTSGTYTPSTTPTAPSAPSVTPNSANGLVVVSWTLLVGSTEMGGASVTRYTAYANIGAGSAVGSCSIGVTSGSGNSCSIAALTYAQPYNFKVSATNAKGEGALSSATSGTISKLTQTISIGSIVVSYQVGSTFKVGDPDTQTLASSDSGLSLQFSVDPAASLVCSVSGTGAVHFMSGGTCPIRFDQDGVSSNYLAASQKTLTLTVLAAKPTAPVLTTLSIGSNGITVSWNKPSRYGSGLAYTIVTSGSGVAPITTTSLRSEVLSAGSLSLTKGILYSFTVTANTDDGNSDTSNSMSATWATPAAAPTVTSAVANATDGRAIDVGWNAVTGINNIGGSAITSYQIGASLTSGGVAVNSCNALATGSSLYTCTIRGLKASSLYYVSGYANNSSGAGAVSNIASATPGLAKSISLLSIGSTAVSSGNSITFTYGSAASTQQINATVSSGESPVYALSGCSAITVGSSGVVHIVRVGSGCLITITSPGSTADSDTEFRDATSKNFTINIAAGKPGAPIVKVTPSISILNVSWTNPTNTGGAPLISPTVAIGGTPCITTGSTTAYCDSLIAGSPYSVTVTVSNGDQSTSSSKDGTPYDVQDYAVSDLEATASISGGLHGITLEWTLPVANDTDAVTNYKIYQTNIAGTSSTLIYDNSIDPVPLITTGSGTNYTAGTTYFFKVLPSFTSGSAGVMSQVSAATTFSVPGPPSAATIAASFNSGSSLASLIVSWDPPLNDGGDPVVSYTATATLSPHITKSCTSNATDGTCEIGGLDAGVVYSVAIVAINGVGTGTELVQNAPSTVQAPTQPIAPTVSSTDNVNGSMTISWSASTGSATGGLPITAYRITSYGGAASPYCVVAQDNTKDTSGYSCVISGLTYKAGYTFKLQAVNGAGTSVVSAASTPAATLSREQNITLTDPASSYPFSNSSITLDASNDAGLSITATISTTSICTVSGLIISFTKVGTCAFSLVSNATSIYNISNTKTGSFSITAGTPDSPELTRLTAGASKLTAAWSPVTNLGGSTFSSYTVNYSSDPNWMMDLHTVSVGSTSTEITGLTAGSMYYVRVLVVTTDATQSSYSNTLNAAPLGAPSAPLNVGATDNHNQTVSINWSVPAQNGGTSITGYKAEAYVDATSVSSGRSCATAATNCLINGLDGSVLYKYKVTAYNAVGEASSDYKTVDWKPGLTQTISAGSLTRTVYHSDISFDLGATSDSGLTLTYSVATSSRTDSWPGGEARNVCTVDSSGIVSVNLAGTCTILISQSGAASAYQAAVSVSVIVTVLASNPTATQAINITPGDTNLIIQWSAPADDGGSPISKYSITWWLTGNGEDLDQSNNETTEYSLHLNTWGRAIVNISALTLVGSTYSYTLRSLTNGSNYTISTQAIGRTLALIGPVI